MVEVTPAALPRLQQSPHQTAVGSQAAGTERDQQVFSATARISDFYRWLIGSSSKGSEAQTTAEQPAGELPDTENKSARQLSGVTASSSNPEAKQQPQGTRISGGNIGFQLLQRAGWQQGQGLGVQGQGRTQPVPAWLQAGRSGIGMAPVTPGPDPPAALNRTRQAAASQPPKKAHQRAEAQPQHQSDKGTADCSGLQVSGGQGQVKAPKRAWATVSVGEDIDTKVKRVRQTCQADRDHAEGKEIQRLLYRALREGPGDVSVSDCSPLLRSGHRLRSRNPLL